jgi:Tfp pilus assembly PilM family ATPase
MDVFQSYAVVNVTASRLQFIELEKISNQIFISNIGQTFLSPSINFDEPVEDIILPQIQNAFDEIKIRYNFKSKLVSFTLPSELFYTIQLPYDANLTQKEIREEFNWEISQLFPFIPVDDLAMKFYELDNKFLPGKNNALVVALPKKYLILLKNFCTINNLQPRLVDNAAISANSFMNSVMNETNRSISVNIYNSRNSMTLFINNLSKPAFVKEFNKHNGEVISSVLNELRTDRFSKILNQSSINAWIAGEEFGSDSLEQIEQELKIKLNFFNPFEFIRFKDHYESHEIPTDYISSFTPAAGAALRFN